MDFEHPLKELIVMGRMSDELDVFGMKVRMKVLNAGQRRDVLGETGVLDAITRGHQIQICTLARAIMSINGQRLQYSPKSKDDPITMEKTVIQNKEYLEQMQQPVLDYLYLRYTELAVRQDQQIEELKKKSVTHGPGPSGPSEKPLASPTSSQ